MFRYESGWIVTLIHSPSNPSVYSLDTLEESDWRSAILSWQATESILTFNDYTGIMSSVNKSRSKYVFADMSSAIQPLLNGDIYYAVVGNSLVNTYVANKYCYLNTSQPELEDYYAVIAYSYNADPTFLKSINLASIAVESSTLNLYNKYFLNNCTVYNTAKPLQINQLIGLYIIVGAGFIVALWVMIAEVVYKEFQLFIDRKRLAAGTRYVFGRFYCAKVIKASLYDMCSIMCSSNLLENTE